MKTIALLTGRGNNTLKDKNILDILGKPVLYYPANAASKALSIDYKFCSSDDEKILDIAKTMSFEKIRRPKELATPTAQHIDCIKHAIKHIEDKGIFADIYVVVLANNVTIKSEWIDICVKKMIDDPTITAVIPVYEDNDHHPLRGKSLNFDGTLSMYEKDIIGEVSTNRQDLPTCFFPAHNFWVLNANFIKSGKEGQQPWSFMGNKIVPFEIEESIDIHDELDLLKAKFWIENNYAD